MPTNMDTAETKIPLTDLHTHILPGMDDGAATVRDSLALLKAEALDGVGAVALTPHFHPLMGLDIFLAQRAKAEYRLKEGLAAENIPVETRAGAEVRMDAALLDIDLSRLCVEGTPLILLELPLPHFPAWAHQVIKRALGQQLVPLLVHVDRYPYLMRRPNTLVPLVNAGVRTHINAASLRRAGKQRQRLAQLIRHGLVHAVASDTHSLDKRPPQLSAGLEIVETHMGAEVAQKLNVQATALFRGEDCPWDKPRPIFWPLIYDN